MKRIVKWGVGVLAFFATAIGMAFVWLWFNSPGTTESITDAQGRPKPGSIATLESMNLGGVKQWVLIRGEHAGNPVLLVLHGGPGFSEMLLYRRYLAGLEKHFTVVLWDQRGAGKSYAETLRPEQLGVAQFVDDTLALTGRLRKRFGKEKIFLLGHSWGSILGIKAVQKKPEWYAAYVGVGQFVHFVEGERESYAFALEQAEAQKVEEAVEALTAVGAPPYRDAPVQKTLTARQWVTYFGGDTYGRQNYLFLLPVFLLGREYTLRDKMNIPKGVQLSLQSVWPTLEGVDFFKQAPTLDVPVYFCAGRHDHVVPSSIAERYYKQLQAPRKGWRWFERSAHNLLFTEADMFTDYLVNTVLKENL